MDWLLLLLVHIGLKAAAHIPLQWAAEQAELYEVAYGSDRGADSDSDYERSSKRRKQQPKKGVPDAAQHACRGYCARDVVDCRWTD